MKRRFFSAILCMTLLAAAPIPARSAKKTVVLALGDSIAAGYGLAKAEDSFPARVAAAAGATLENNAIVGQTSGEMLAALQAGTWDDALRRADVVLISIGSNDLLRELNGSASGQTTAMYQALLGQVAGVGFDATTVNTIASQFSKNFAGILARIHQAHPGVPVVALNLYNPFAKQTIAISRLSISVGDTVEPWIQRMNDAFPVSADYVLADAFTPMNAAGYTNAAFSTGAFDPHPNTAGHKLLSDAVLAAMPLKTLLASGLSDVKDADWFSVPASFAYARGLAGSAGRFAPSTVVTRGAMAQMLGSFDGIRRTDYPKSGFSDVPAARADAPYIAWAASKGITSGVGGDRFDPDATVTREQLCTFLYRYIALRDKGLADTAKKAAAARNYDFRDASAISSWARDSVQAIAALGLVQGSGQDNFRPQDTATRAEMSAILLRLHNLLTIN